MSVAPGLAGSTFFAGAASFSYLAILLVSPAVVIILVPPLIAIVDIVVVALLACSGAAGRVLFGRSMDRGGQNR